MLMARWNNHDDDDDPHRYDQKIKKNGQTPAADYVGILCKDGNNDAGIYPKW